MLSILALYNYEPTVFSEMVVPEGIDKAQLISTICLQNAELDLLYSDPGIMRTAIGMWSRTSAYSWDKLAKTLDLEYNPIWNKDATITEEETIGREAEGSSSGVNKVSAYNSDDFENRDSSEAEGSSSEDVTRNYERKEQGNLGITTAQSMIREERDVAMFNLYDTISEDFKRRFCLCVY